MTITMTIMTITMTTTIKQAALRFIIATYLFSLRQQIPGLDALLLRKFTFLE